MNKRYVIYIIIITIIITGSRHAYSGETVTSDIQATVQVQTIEPPIVTSQVTKIDPPVTDKTTSKSKPWSEMSAGERTVFILAIPIVIPAVVIAGAWDIAVGTIKILGPGAADIINKYR